MGLVSKKHLVLNSILLAAPWLAKLPPIRRRLERADIGTGGTDSAAYCYSVWLRHLTRARDNGLNCRPEVVAELGPGDSLGIGCAALLCGAEKYYALDVVSHSKLDQNLVVLDGLVDLFSRRANIPDDTPFPRVVPKLKSYSFPNDVLSESFLTETLEPSRIQRIKYSLQNPNAPDSMIRYSVPWLSEEMIEIESVDLIISQAVLEHVDDLPGAYKAMRSWLKPGGYVSHVIDFKCHGTADTWDGHWAYSDLMWKVIRGKRTWLINREPKFTHINLMTRFGFSAVDSDEIHREPTIDPSRLAKRFESMPESDRSTSDLFVQAVLSEAPR